MMKAMFVTPFDYALGQPKLPPMRAENGVQLVYTDEYGVEHGGFTCVSYAPDSTVMVLVHSSPETIAAMSEDPDNVFVEEVIDG
ncbi:MAG: hypothetical protein M1546_19815 [Chloroflexi bacterium]|nr:hypothetical protein [Chloroflexota bacterium]